MKIPDPQNSPRRIKLTLEYDGTDFKGWQVQSRELGAEETGETARTVQGVVERALFRISGHPVRIAGASRTDAGVHARGQVASLLLPAEFELDNEQLCMALNSHLDKDVTAVRAELAPLEFHAMRDAAGKIYTYSIFQRRIRSSLLRRNHWHVRFALDSEKMRTGARHLVGMHDFTSFATKLKETQAKRVEDGKSELETVREVRRVDVRTDPLMTERIVIEVEGSGFLYQMVRTIAGTLVDVGRGFRPPEWVAEALAAKDRRAAGPTAPPHGLCLEKVIY